MRSNDAKVLVLGATGFVGRNLVQRLLKDGFFVRVLTRKNTLKSHKNIEVICGDLTSSAFKLNGLADSCQIIFNCAGQISDVSQMHSLHVDATSRVINEVIRSSNRESSTKQWIQLSSVGAYGVLKLNCNSNTINENSQPKPEGVYEISKFLSDKLVIKASSNSNFTYTILRPSNIVGDQMTNRSFLGLLRAIKKRTFFYIGSKKSIATYIHVDDVVDALIESLLNQNAKNQIFNISNDCFFEDIVTKVARHNNDQHRYLCLPERPLRFIVKLLSKLIRVPLTQKRIDALVSQTTYPCTKIKSLLGLTPSRSIPTFSFEYLKSNNEKN